jgi:hypothetical protein
MIASTRKLRPQGAEARAVFDAVEEMRIQALGANALKGVSGNLTAALTDSLERRGAARMNDRAVGAVGGCRGLDGARAADGSCAAGERESAGGIVARILKATLALILIRWRTSSKISARSRSVPQCAQ